MRTWVKKLCLAIAIGLIITGGTAYFILEPTHYFQRKDHPVLAYPLPEALPVATNGGGMPANSSLAGKLGPAAEESGSPAVSSSFNVLILGVDARDAESSRTDLIMVAHIVPDRRKVSVISIPRDTRVELEGIGSTKVNHAHFIGNENDGSEGGIKAAIQAVSNLLDVPIHYHVKLDFFGFEKIVDEIGGVELELSEEVRLTQSLKGRSPLTLEKGKHTLSGELALDFVRERFSRSNGEFGRQEAQMEVIRSITEKVTRPDYLPKLPGLITQIKDDLLETNFENADLVSLAWMFKNMEGSQLEYTQLPGESLRAVDPLIGTELYYWQPDYEIINAIIQEKFQ